MKCPRCSYEWDIRLSPCPRCSLHIPVPDTRGSANKQSSMGGGPFDDFVSSPPVGNRAVPFQSGYLRRPVTDNLTQSRFSTSSINKFPASRSPLPSTGKLKPLRKPAPLSDAAHVLDVQQAPAIPRVSSLEMQAEAQQLLPGTTLHRGRYSLQKSLHKQEWPLGIVETTWAAFDTRISKSLGIIRDLYMPDSVPVELNLIAYTATKTFTSIGRNGHILPLRDVFSDQRHNFFVFEPVDGLSLLTLMFNNGRKLTEKEVINCCLQILELLDICLRQSPPLIHGNIRPEYIVRKSSDSQYVLTNFSVALAGGLAWVMADMEGREPSPQISNVHMQGKMDGRVDLYMLLEVAAYAITGQWLSGMGENLIHKMLTASNISPHLQAILLKGLRASPEQRYQTPAELYQDLLVLQSGYKGELSSRHFAMSELGTLPSVPAVPVVKPEPIAPLIADLSVEGPLEQTLLVPLPEELPPLKESNDMRNAVFWFIGMLFCLLLILGHGLL